MSASFAELLALIGQFVPDWRKAAYAAIVVKPIDEISRHF
jgi:hypothetical protein